MNHHWACPHILVHRGGGARVGGLLGRVILKLT